MDLKLTTVKNILVVIVLLIHLYPTQAIAGPNPSAANCITLLRKQVKRENQLKYSRQQRLSGEALKRNLKKARVVGKDAALILKKLRALAQDLAKNNFSNVEKQPRSHIKLLRAMYETEVSLSSLGLNSPAAWAMIFVNRALLKEARDIKEILTQNPKISFIFHQLDKVEIHQEGGRRVMGKLPRSLENFRIIYTKVKKDHVRIYRGSKHPKEIQVSNALRGKPADQIPSGEFEFLTQKQALDHINHAQGFHPDGVSVSTKLEAASIYAKAVVVYDIPLTLLRKLPDGDPYLGEKVFKHSVPDHFRVGVIRAVSATAK